MSAGALRKASLRYDGHADHPLLASVPVSFDFSPDRISGNYFTGMMVAVPTDREGFMAAPHAAYRPLLRGMLDVTEVCAQLTSMWVAVLQDVGCNSGGKSWACCDIIRSK